MKSVRSHKTIIAVAFALALIVANSAQASNLLGLSRDRAPRAAVEQSAGLFNRVATWLIGAWTGLTSVFAAETTTPPPTTAGNCDAGLGLDPEGCPR